MMKWGRKKPSSSSPSSSTSSSIFPKSWFSKLIHKDISPSQKPEKSSPKPNPNPQPQTVSSGLKNSSFQGPGDEAYSSIYFVEDRSGIHRATGNSLPVLDKFDDDRELLPLPTCRDCTRDVWKFNDMVSGMRKLSVEASPEGIKERGRQELIEPGRKAVKDQKLRRTCRKILEQKMQELERIPEEETPEEKDIFEAKVHHTRKNSNPTNNSAFQDLNSKERFELSEEKANSEWKQLKEMKIREVKSKGEKQRKSVYVSREQQRRSKQSCRVKAYSPRTAARIECKIKALEDMKKARMMRKIKQMNGAEKRTLSDSYAVAKSSFDPANDFRSSMIEMITEKDIKRAEELEELLACYLTLNADEYHDLIIKVFRQVWFELNNGPEK